jgi:hypothetical protein
MTDDWYSPFPKPRPQRVPRAGEGIWRFHREHVVWSSSSCLLDAIHVSRRIGRHVRFRLRTRAMPFERRRSTGAPPHRPSARPPVPNPVTSRDIELIELVALDDAEADRGTRRANDSDTWKGGLKSRPEALQGAHACELRRHDPRVRFVPAFVPHRGERIDLVGCGGSRFHVCRSSA